MIYRWSSTFPDQFNDELLQVDPVSVAPANEDVDCPNTRPAQARRPVEKRLPYTRHHFRVKARGLDRLRISHGPVYHLAETGSQPTIIGQNEAGLRPFK